MDRRFRPTDHQTVNNHSSGRVDNETCPTSTIEEQRMDPRRRHFDVDDDPSPLIVPIRPSPPTVYPLDHECPSIKRYNSSNEIQENTARAKLQSGLHSAKHLHHSHNSAEHLHQAEKTNQKLAPHVSPDRHFTSEHHYHESPTFQHHAATTTMQLGSLNEPQNRFGSQGHNRGVNRIPQNAVKTKLELAPPMRLELASYSRAVRTELELAPPRQPQHFSSTSTQERAPVQVQDNGLQSSSSAQHDAIQGIEHEGVYYHGDVEVVDEILDADILVVRSINPTRWFMRPLYLGILAMVCFLLVLLVVLIVTVFRRPAGSSTTGTFGPTSPLTTPPTPEQAPQVWLPGEEIACNFLSETSVDACRSDISFDSWRSGDKVNGTTIPSEIGLLTQLRKLWMDYSNLTGGIPSSIENLKQLTSLSFTNNALTGSIPSSLCSSRREIYIDCGEVECSCCLSWNESLKQEGDCV